MEQHVLANRRYGTVDDQRRLALRIYDDAFMACAVCRVVICIVISVDTEFPSPHPRSPFALQATPLRVLSVIERVHFYRVDGS